jgi:hypothetical protein
MYASDERRVSVKFLKWADIPKDAQKIRFLPTTHDSVTMFMKKEKVEKIIVPPRAERYEEMGDPKAPKMGKLTPTKIEIPEVDDLLEKMKKVTAPLEMGGCDINCQCLPCRQGACSGCHVERLRYAEPSVLREAAAKYRGVIYG